MLPCLDFLSRGSSRFFLNQTTLWRSPSPLKPLTIDRFIAPSYFIQFISLVSEKHLKMSPEIIQTPLLYPRSRPRAATDRVRSGRASSPLYFQHAPHAMSPPAVSMSRSPAAGNQTSGGVARVRPRATSASLRQPQPLSPSDIHSILEQEQEAMVNRLSRELSLLRHQTSSIASTASPTPTAINDPLDALQGQSYLSGPIYPTASRRHRSSSSLSAAYFPVVHGSRTGGRSRQPSTASTQRSHSVVSPTSKSQERKQDPSVHVANSPQLYSRRGSVSQRTVSGSSVGRSDETVLPRELESLAHENEILRRRIRELELSTQQSQIS
ncbi:hypothetical protein BJX61DRAFT_467006 [Aspergillus egyptiacus]|nr:hypothetical protein BJX61DRAFT_467006 [Aspergillus egyptiacus]